MGFSMLIARWLKKPFWATLAPVIVSVSIGCSVASPETQMQEDFFVAGGSTIVEASIENGNIEVMGDPTGGSGIRVTATLRQPDRVEYSAVQEGDTIKIIGEADDGFSVFGGGNGGVDLEVSVPADIDLSLEASNGGITVKGVTGPILAATSNGRITVSDSTGDLEVNTSNGRIELLDVTGQVVGKTSNGSISYRGTLRPGSENKLETSNGSIDVSLKDTAGVDLEATTSNGTVKSPRPITIQGESKEDELIGTIGDGGTTLMLHTSNGSISIE